MPGDVIPMTTSGAERVLADLDETVGVVSPALKPYTILEYTVLFFLTGNGDLDAG